MDDRGDTRPGRGFDRWRVGETEPRVAGLPLSWFAWRSEVDTRAVRHPVKWIRWRARLRRLGPYAPDFDPEDTAHQPGSE